jgi:hypothetical protein
VKALENSTSDLTSWLKLTHAHLPFLHSKFSAVYLPLLHTVCQRIYIYSAQLTDLYTGPCEGIFNQQLDYNLYILLLFVKDFFKIPLLHSDSSETGNIFLKQLPGIYGVLYSAQKALSAMTDKRSNLYYIECLQQVEVILEISFSKHPLDSLKAIIKVFTDICLSQEVDFLLTVGNDNNISNDYL